MSVHIFATVIGKDQGSFRGESTQKGFEKKIPGVGLAFGVLAPYDPTTGQGSGKHQHQPIVFTKEWGASSPQFYKAAYENELLTSVIFEVYKTSPAGVQQVDHTIKLTDATLSEVSDSLFLGPAEGGQAGGAPVDSRDLQQITLIFKKIEIEIEIESAKVTIADTVVAGAMASQEEFSVAVQRAFTVRKPIRLRTTASS